MKQKFDFSKYIKTGLAKAYREEHTRRIKEGIVRKKARNEDK